MGILRAGRGLIVAACAAAAASIAAADVHEVQQVELEFIPDEITVAPGDTIRWIWNDGFHTVTSGSHEKCAFDGVHFNESLFAGNPIVEWKVPEDLEGPLPYICLPHCTLDMVAMIFVELDPGCEGDFDGNGRVDFDDLLRLLNAWGPCPPEGECPEDIDDSERVDFDDLLILLANYGPCD